MRGEDERSGSLFSYVDLEARVGKDHPLRTIRGVVNEALASLSSEFSALYALMGRPSIPPEKLLRAMLLQVFYTIRSERQLMERLEFDLLFRWFVGMGVDDRAWDHSTFSKNRERLLEGDIAAKLLSAVMAQPRVKRLLSSDHFSVDGTLIEAWASMKSFRPRDGSDDPPPSGGVRNRAAGFHGQKRSNKTHASTTDPEARLYREGPGVREHGAQRWRRKAGRFRTQWGCPKTDLPIMRSLSSSSLAFSADARSRPARRFPNRGPRLGREVTLLPSLRSKRHRVSLRQGRLSGHDS